MSYTGEVEKNGRKRQRERSFTEKDYRKKSWMDRSLSGSPKQEEDKTIKAEYEETSKKDLTVVRSPKELAEIADPFELQKMGYDFMVAASQQLKNERESLQEQVTAYKVLIQKQIKDQEKERKSVEIKNNIYEKVIKTLKEQKEELENSLTKKIGELEEEINSISRCSDDQKKENLTLQDELKVKNNKVEELTCKLQDHEDEMKAKDAKLNQMPCALQFFLQRYLANEPKIKKENDQHSTLTLD